MHIRVGLTLLAAMLADTFNEMSDTTQYLTGIFSNFSHFEGLIFNRYYNHGKHVMYVIEQKQGMFLSLFYKLMTICDRGMSFSFN